MLLVRFDLRDRPRAFPEVGDIAIVVTDCGTVSLWPDRLCPLILLVLNFAAGTIFMPCPNVSRGCLSSSMDRNTPAAV